MTAAKLMKLLKGRVRDLKAMSEDYSLGIQIRLDSMIREDEVLGIIDVLKDLKKRGKK